MKHTTIDLDVYTPEGKRAAQVSTPVLGNIKLKRFPRIRSAVAKIFLGPLSVKSKTKETTK